jgi:uncharacterized membrane protein
MTARIRRDEGQVTVAILGFAMIILLLLAVVVSGSRVFLGQRDLAAAADSAAASAAQAVSEPAVYGGVAGAELPIDPEAAQARVAEYVVLAGLVDHFDDFAVVAVTVTGTTVTVTFTARAPMPYGGLLNDEWDGGYPITATATAHSPFTT